MAPFCCFLRLLRIFELWLRWQIQALSLQLKLPVLPQPEALMLGWETLILPWIQKSRREKENRTSFLIWRGLRERKMEQTELWTNPNLLSFTSTKVQTLMHRFTCDTCSVQLVPLTLSPLWYKPHSLAHTRSYNHLFLTVTHMNVMRGTRGSLSFLRILWYADWRLCGWNTDCLKHSEVFMMDFILINTTILVRGLLYVIIFFSIKALNILTLSWPGVTGEGHRRIGGQKLRAISHMTSAAAASPTTGPSVSLELQQWPQEVHTCDLKLHVGLWPSVFSLW